MKVVRIRNRWTPLPKWRPTLRENQEEIFMKKIVKYGIAVMVCMIICLFPVSGYGDTEADKSLSPYFLVKSDDPEVDQLP